MSNTDQAWAADWIITIDGPAGAGKTTISRLLARKLGYSYLDTGALYRAVGLLAMEKGISPDDDKELEKLCRGMDLRFAADGRGTRLVVNGRDISQAIRSPEVSMMASGVSARRVVRQCLLGVQRRLGKDGAIVAEGRDMGTVVFPDAQVKFFLDADLDTRARRRFEQLKGQGCLDKQSLEQIKSQIAVRDRNDAGRKLAPLRPAADAYRIDSSVLTIGQVVTDMLLIIRKRNL